MSDKKPNILLLTQITRNLSVMLEDTKSIKNDLAEIKQFIKENFSWDKMKELVHQKLKNDIPDIPVQTPLNLSNIGLPKLNKI